MTYNGIEIDMLSLGDADSILVTSWSNGHAVRVLIDGGNRGSAATIRGFLRAQGVRYLDHVVCTHPHDDHAAGLVQLLADASLPVGRVWVHRPQAHVNMLLVEHALNQAHGFQRARVIRESLETITALSAICVARGIPTSEPFAGQQIGMLTVVGPTRAYYSELVAQFADASAIRASESLVSALPNQNLLEALLESLPAPASDSLEANPQTEPENNSSVILAIAHESGTHLFTGDAGAQALTLAAQHFNLGNCHWMQIPHHGSRRNITEPLIQHFRPNQAFVSAAGNPKHPRRAVVNAFKNVGTQVFSTHYPRAAPLWHHRGVVPPRTGYSAATALWETNT
jgi:beta-lactamase superfamily II metal-dependent hydrolase